MGDPAEEPSDLHLWRVVILDRVLAWTAIVGLVPTVAGISLALRYDLWPVAVIDTLCWGIVAGLALLRGWSYPARATAALLVFLSLGAAILAATGPYGVGLLWLLAVPVLAGLLGESKALWLSQLGVLLALLLVASLEGAGLLAWPGPEAPLVWWLMAVSSIACISLMVGLSTSTVTQRLQRSLDAVRRDRAALCESNEALRREIEARQRAERERESVQRQLALSQKMEAVGQLAGGFAHDLNNVLTVIRLESGLARGEVADGTEAAESLDHVLQASDSAAALCARLLLFARRRHGERARVDIDETISSFAPLLLRLASERSRVALSLRSEHARVSAAQIEIEQVLVNLVGNARDAMPEGGTIAISTEQVVCEQGPCVQITVADEGIGMDEATAARIFEPFFTTKPEGAGTGLGLSTVYGIVSDLGGEISVQSAKGCGARFFVRLPIDAESAGEIALRAPLAVRLPATPRRVLLAEDQPMVRSVVERLLGQLGCLVSSTSSADEAIAWLERSPPPDLVLTDVVMPGRSGVDLAERVRERYPGVAVIAMSGYLGSEDLAARLEALSVPLLRKPFTPDDLAQILGEQLAARAS